MRQAQPFPMLTTERLELRAVQSSDASFYHQLLSVAEVTRFSDLPDFRMFGRVAADPID
jgi:RimJ/RimL family protein N-acetyltransferase